MKATILFLALVGSVNAFADLNCQATLDGATADKKQEAAVEAKRVYAENTPPPAPRTQSTQKTTTGK
jgi:hypothetical protein